MKKNFFLSSKFLPTNFAYPKEYSYLIELGLTDFAVWNFIESPRLDRTFQRVGKAYSKKIYIPFAEQQGSDDLACWVSGENSIYIIEDYSSDGNEIMNIHNTFWDWFREAIAEMIEFIDYDLNSTT